MLVDFNKPQSMANICLSNVTNFRGLKKTILFVLNFVYINCERIHSMKKQNNIVIAFTVF